MTWKIFRSILFTSLMILFSALLVFTGILHAYFSDIQEDELRDELNLAAAAVESIGLDYLEKLSSDRYRLTWVEPSGNVLYDTHSQTSAETMDNHAEREEIKEAIATGFGSSSRYSTTLTEETLYEAKRLTDGTVLRISTSYSTTGALLLGLLQPTCFITLIAAVLSGVLADKMSKRIVEPLNKLNLEKPLENEAYEELAPLLNRIHSLHNKIDHQMNTLKHRKEEFDHITENMQEGLVLLDAEDRILSINPAAMKLFSADRHCIGSDFLQIDRHTDLIQAIRQAQTQGHNEILLSRGAHTYQCDISNIESNGIRHGTVLLLFDITAKEESERIRREFSANVSHELKTPLQSIIGSAELIENGIVKEEDMPRFIGHIRREATRLVTLIEDIIRLSQLDEGGSMPTEEVDLRRLTEDVFSSLQTAASEKNVTLHLEGEGTINGVRRLLYEILYNLCDNGIKYNREGGNVTVSIKDLDTQILVSVSDTGIGIPMEHQDRIFERFYRVDKSHSKASGGTGLGLSIVKHATQLHHGKIHLNSEADHGTTVEITLPKM